MRSLACFLLALSPALAACGGKVVVDTGTAGALVCADVCAQATATCSQKMASCTASCAALDKLGAACPDAYQVFLACTEANPSELCGAPGSACTAEVTAFTQCISKTCAVDPAKCMP